MSVEIIFDAPCVFLRKQVWNLLKTGLRQLHQNRGYSGHGF
ncbi:hypothetical protein HMPREF1554_01107 [Porphyromonas gingivalis F0569]|nr:hypothetical protein HMPREF1554_01107 [Porphyromonas gingivalis F0569]